MIKKIYLKDFDIQDIPDKEFICFIIYNISFPQDYLIKHLIQKGRCILTGEDAEKYWHEQDNIEKKYKKRCNKVILDDFIDILASKEKQSINEEILFLYDDEKLKDYIIKRIKQKAQEIINKRVELNCHTNYRDGVNTPNSIIQAAKIKHLSGIAFTDKESVVAYKEIQEAEKENIKVLYGASFCDKNVTIICRNAKGKNVLYRYITSCASHCEDFSIIKNNRDDLLVGVSCFNESLIQAAIDDDLYTIKNIIKDADYIEVAPIETYKAYWDNYSIFVLQNVVKLIIDISIKENKKVISTSCPHYINVDDKEVYEILFKEKNDRYFPEDASLGLYSTEEMLYAFDWLDDDKLVEDIVINNPNYIMSLCETFNPIDNIYHRPILENAYKRLVEKANKRLKEVYGNCTEEIIINRFNEELNIIQKENYAEVFLLYALLCDEATKQGYHHQSFNGVTSSSFISWLLGLTEINPLPPHTVCPKCFNVVWYLDEEDGFDIKEDICKRCEAKTKKDGHNLSYKLLFQEKEDRNLDLCVSFESGFNKDFNKIIKNIAPDNNYYTLGIINYYESFPAHIMIYNYFDNEEGLERSLYIEDLIYRICECFESYDICFNARVIVPKNVEVEDFTPLFSSGVNIYSTRTNYNFIKDNFFVLDYRLNSFLNSFKYIDEKELNFYEIDINDPEIYELIEGKKNYGTIGIKGKIMDSSNTIELKSKKFSELVKIENMYTKHYKNEYVPITESIATVLYALRMAWIKIHKPKVFYKMIFKSCGIDYEKDYKDKTTKEIYSELKDKYLETSENKELEVVLEMKERGIELD